MEVAVLDLDEIQSFVCVATCGGFRKAADRLGCTQSTVSHHVSQLEKRFGRALFLRTTRSVRLTDEGEQLLEEAQRLLEAEASLREHFSISHIQGRVRLGASEEVASTKLPPILARFSQTHPGVSLEVKVGTSVELIRACQEGTMDVALVKRPPDSEHGEVLWREPLVWAAANHFRQDRNTSIPLALYQQEESISRRTVLDALRTQQRRFHVIYTSFSLEGIRAAVVAGLAVAAMPQSALGKGMTVLGEEANLPALDVLTYIVMRRRRQSGALAIDRLYGMLCETRK